MHDNSDSTVDLKAMLRQLSTDPIAAIRKCRHDFVHEVKAHNEALYHTLAFMVAFVRHLKQHEEDLQTFLQIEYWTEKPHRPKAKNISRLAAMYVVGAKKSEGPLYDSALDYTKVVDHFIDQGTEVEQIPGKLRQQPIYTHLQGVRGIREAIEDDRGDVVDRESEPGLTQGTSVAKRVTPARPGELFNDRNDPFDDDDGSETDDLLDENDRGRANQRIRVDDPKPRRPAFFDPQKHLALQGDRYLQLILAMEPGEERWALIERFDDEARDWKEYRVVRVE